MYNASNNELVRTNTLVKSAIIQVDATPFRQWYEAHVSSLIVSNYATNLIIVVILQYAQPVTKKGVKKDTEETEEKKLSNHAQRALDERKKGESFPVAVLACTIERKF